MKARMWVVDTSALIPLLGDPTTQNELERHRREAGAAFLGACEAGTGHVLIPTTVIVELMHGADCEPALRALLLRPGVTVVSLGEADAYAAGRAARTLAGGASRQRIKFDACVAGVAIARQVGAVITYDEHFERLPGLTVGGWPSVEPIPTQTSLPLDTPSGST